MKKEILPESEHFYNGLKNDPEAIISWCEDEIRAYKGLIKLIKGQNEDLHFRNWLYSKRRRNQK